METSRNESRQLSKAMEINRRTLEQYEHVIKEQQNFIEQLQNERFSQVNRRIFPHAVPDRFRSFRVRKLVPSSMKPSETTC